MSTENEQIVDLVLRGAARAGRIIAEARGDVAPPPMPPPPPGPYDPVLCSCCQRWMKNRAAKQCEYCAFADCRKGKPCRVPLPQPYATLSDLAAAVLARLATAMEGRDETTPAEDANWATERHYLQEELIRLTTITPAPGGSA